MTSPPTPSGRPLLRSLVPPLLMVGLISGALYYFRAVLSPFILAVVLVYLMEPVVQRLNYRGTFGFHWPRWVAIVSVYLTVLSSLVAFGFFAIPTLTVEMSKLAREAPTIMQNTKRSAIRYTHMLELYLNIEPLSDVPELMPNGEKTEKEALAPALILEPLADGRYAVQLGGFDIEAKESSDGYTISLDPRGDAQNGKGSDSLSVLVDRQFGELLQSSGEGLGQAILVIRRLAEGIFGSIISLILTFMLAAFISIDLDKILGYFRSFVPKAARQSGDILLTQLDRRLSGVIRGQLIICLVNGFLTYLLLELLGMRFVAILTILATAFTLIPIFGMIISSVPAIVIALVDGGIEQGVILFVGIMAIHFLEANVFNPKIIGTAARISPVLIIFALLAGEHSFGLLGALLAAPAMAVAVTLFQYVVEHIWLRPNGLAASKEASPIPAEAALPAPTPPLE